MSSFVPIGGPTTSGPTPSFTPLDATPPAAPAPVAAPAKPAGFISNVISGAKAVGSDVIGAVKSAFSSAPAQDIFSDPAKAANATVTDLISSLTAAGKQMTQNASSAMSATGDTVVPNQSGPKGALGTGIAAVSGGLGAINAAFAPINSIIEYAQHVPALGTLATGLNALFGAIGAGGADAAEGSVAALPVSQSVKDQITPVAREAGALAAQIIAGKGGEAAYSMLADHTNAILTHLDNGIDVAKATVEHGTFQPLPVTEEGAAPSPTVPESVYHGTSSGDFSTDQRDNINFGSSPEEVSQFAGDKGKVLSVPLDKFNVKDFPTKEAMYDAASQGKADHIAQGVDILHSDGQYIGINPETISQITGNKIAPDIRDKVVGPTDAKPLQTEPGQSRIGRSIEQKAIEAGLTERFDKTAGYDPKTVPDQIKRTADIVANNHEDMRAMVRGDLPLPDGISHAMFIDAVEQHLEHTPDAQLAYELANSPLTSETSIHAQEMRFMRERKPDGITARYKEIKAAREAALEKRGGNAKQVKKITEELKKEVRKNASKRQDWADFAKEIACNY